MLFYIL